jgi:hypothetical protein
MSRATQIQEREQLDKPGRADRRMQTRPPHPHARLRKLVGVHREHTALLCWAVLIEHTYQKCIAIRLPVNSSPTAPRSIVFLGESASQSTISLG